MKEYFLDHYGELTFKMDHEPTIHSFYGVALPVTQNDIEFLERRNIKVQFLKRQLGEKYGDGSINIETGEITTIATN